MKRGLLYKERIWPQMKPILSLQLDIFLEGDWCAGKQTVNHKNCRLCEKWQQNLQVIHSPQLESSPMRANSSEMVTPVQRKNEQKSLFLTLKGPRKTASENVICLCRLLANFSKLFFAYRQKVWTQIRLLLKEQSDLGPHCLQK